MWEGTNFHGHPWTYKNPKYTQNSMYRNLISQPSKEQFLLEIFQTTFNGGKAQNSSKKLNATFTLLLITFNYFRYVVFKDIISKRKTRQIL